ncbi:8503_t:CDS:2 [Scutellospora calospora]|uniref:8503_t:CDS:1 n=1 Tax=Scutellospora calospora TaxID=85575 RepID=A0ACA9LDE6_9GLOM|nr:8503_t:CDS:2 [Scutellospora calospora]
MSDDKKILDEEIARIKQLLKDQEVEIDIEKRKCDQLLEMFSNVKKNVADSIKESLPEILNKVIKNINIGDDVKKLVTEKSGEVIEKLNKKNNSVDNSKNIDEIVKIKSFYPNDIDLNKKIKEKIQEALKDPNLDQEEKKDLLNDGIFNSSLWRAENFFKYFTDLDVAITTSPFKE